MKLLHNANNNIEWGAPISRLRQGSNAFRRCVCFSHNFLFAVCAFLLFPPSRYRSIRAIFAYWFVFHLSDRPFSPLCDSNKVRYCEIWCHFLHSFLSFFAHLLFPSCTMGSIVEVFVCGFDWYALNRLAFFGILQICWYLIMASLWIRLD